ncbi:hypothetical protein GlitD10_1808 [Gloeomargarita lithophora Alchichica-D10]|uniref:HicB-like antitoxin of toxin-antitoxin system domain-containing protein n=1 Tax=Gloeomargarita lithophora Alchichica-D10 TaxID=1188229 RepID=A0A1J0ADW6_9CYAN|nr:type II toxin-antitoxin system HicB family antitoxin [Gloeomargarita lithophora]APB34134.1 hypothetical protein GlitD10_1808 [Gloeomargarita lithophora Alchichica-D10]
MEPHYSILIQWSEADHCYIASLPEWGDTCHTHGDTYAEALRHALEVLELLQANATEANALPDPVTFSMTPSPIAP